MPGKKLLHQIQPPQRLIRAVACCPANDVAATAGDRIVLWDLRKGTELVRLSWDEQDTSLVLAVAFSANGRFLASGHSDHVARIWDVESKRQVAVLREHVDGFAGEYFTPKDQCLLPEVATTQLLCGVLTRMNLS